MAAAAHSLVIPLAIFRERLGIDEAIELIRLEEDHQVFIAQSLSLSIFSEAFALLRNHYLYLESGTKLFEIGSEWHKLRRNLPSIG